MSIPSSHNHFPHPPQRQANAVCSFECIISRTLYLANFKAGDGEWRGLRNLHINLAEGEKKCLPLSSLLLTEDLTLSAPRLEPRGGCVCVGVSWGCELGV
jgi:hypothetical protein